MWSFAPPRRVPEAIFSARLAVHCVPSCGSRPSEPDEMKYVLASTDSMCICRPTAAGQYQRFSEVAARSRRPRNDGLGTNWLNMVARRLLNNLCCPNRNGRIPLISGLEPVGIPGVSDRSPRQSRCELSGSWFDSGLRHVVIGRSRQSICSRPVEPLPRCLIFVANFLIRSRPVSAVNSTFAGACSACNTCSTCKPCKPCRPRDACAASSPCTTPYALHACNA